MREFVDLVRSTTGAAYDHKAVSLLERDEQGWRRKDMVAFAAVDPKKRGAAWLGFGVTELPSETELAIPEPEPRKKRRRVKGKAAPARAFKNVTPKRGKPAKEA